MKLHLLLEENDLQMEFGFYFLKEHIPELKKISAKRGRHQYDRCDGE